ncbi:TIGR03936 family radical SAM-associated protein [uncultured Candidatus Kuenenia sp.]|uniref:TIGR03936 family radical SAM-associated protein n=1 Tax=uncultured Candidatus Kuenenia sp. TaxID=1048336 RepID=UPI002A4E1133|nr:TIGR03936 family radical SAM-associated protein [uncultured Candidatus Kuenenia sp.]
MLRASRFVFRIFYLVLVWSWLCQFKNVYLYGKVVFFTSLFYEGWLAIGEKIRIRFSKSGDIRFISHNDLMRTIERIIRRANIPIAMSKGFNPHPKISMPLALGVGMSGEDEILELELLHHEPLELLVERFRRQLPEGIRIVSAWQIPLSERGAVDNVTYKIIFKNKDILQTLKIEDFWNEHSIVIKRMKKEVQKSVEIRSSVQKIWRENEALFLTFRLTPDGMPRPEEVVSALGVDINNELFEIIRTEVDISSV